MKTEKNRNNIVLASLVSGFFLLALFLPSPVNAGSWAVSPVRVEFGKGAKSGVITVSNEEEAELLTQLTAFEWSQDADGKDVYGETDNVIFFPKILKFDKKESKIVRIGIKIPATTTEKTYRLFIQEIPKPSKSEGVSVGISLKFGVPIFVKPLNENRKGEISNMRISKGIIEAMLKNTGNEHFRINSVTVKGTDSKGGEIFSKESAGWYLLGGASRPFSIDIPQEFCPNVAKVSMEVKADKLSLNGNLDVDKTMCLP